LVAGEFEYWRHHTVFWPKILGLMKSSGLEFVATFVCWDFHEIARGDFDFVGRTHPSRDLAGFIDASAEAGLQVLIRVGPIMDAEWPSRGPAPDVTPLERLHPQYLERTREYGDSRGARCPGLY
jgi:beta-galactosidase GanA